MQMFILYPVRWYEQLLLNQRDVVGMNDLVLYINDCAVSICTAASAIERLYSICTYGRIGLLFLPTLLTHPALKQSHACVIDSTLDMCSVDKSLHMRCSLHGFCLRVVVTPSPQYHSTLQSTNHRYQTGVALGYTPTLSSIGPRPAHDHFLTRQRRYRWHGCYRPCYP